MGKPYVISPVGVFMYPWVNKPDTKFSNGGAGLFKVDLLLRGEPAATLRAKIDAAVDAAWDEITAEMTPGDIKKYAKAYPYEIVEDDQGHPTGDVKFHFKQNASIKDRATQEEKPVSIGIYDSANNPIHKPVFGGSEGRVRYAMRNYKFASGKTISVRLDFAMVQVVKMAASTGGGSAFGKVEDGYVEESDGQEGFPQRESSGSSAGDY